MVTVYIYDEKLKIIARPIVNSYEEFIANPSGTYQAWNPDNHIADIQEFKNAIIVDGELRDKKREESILLDNELELLQPGEYVADNKIIFVECPKDLYKPLWQSPIWIEGATLDEVKEEKRLELKKCRDEGTYAPYLYESNGHLYDADLNSRSRLFQAQQLGVGTTANINWITADNQISSVSNNDLNNIVNGIAIREQELFSKFSNKYNQVLSYSTVEEVKSVFWD